ncbi:hypothetical protein KP509_11G033300 [Ceratopteris richardii]|uniref:EF-hand domain-containing protein n=1 Tax=Ceratopteris richardii TaxID=49495 RepID=A0A8T2TQC8_CERRI|nr:hypothetical protein KP509_11G033300 [Ceratopteris richardii]
MSVVVLDGSTVRDFVEDKEAFEKAMDVHFCNMDLNHDGTLSRSEIRAAFERMRLLECTLGMPDAKTPGQLNELYDSVFEKFDTDHNGTVDLSEFRVQMRDILLAIADGLGTSPLQVVIDEGSFLEDAVKHEENVA